VSRKVNGRVWLSDALTRGSVSQPEDPQVAVVDGVEHTVVVLASVLLRRLGSEPDMPLAELAEHLQVPLEEVVRAQAAVEQVAADVGV
jgi:hypothetical protein